MSDQKVISNEEELYQALNKIVSAVGDEEKVCSFTAYLQSVGCSAARALFMAIFDSIPVKTITNPLHGGEKGVIGTLYYIDDDYGNEVAIRQVNPGFSLLQGGKKGEWDTDIIVRCKLPTLNKELGTYGPPMREFHYQLILGRKEDGQYSFFVREEWVNGKLMRSYSEKGEEHFRYREFRPDAPQTS